MVSEKTQRLIEIRDDLCNSFVVDREAIDKIANLRFNKMRNFRSYSWANTVMAAYELKSRTGRFPELLGSYKTWNAVNRRCKKGAGLSILFPRKSLALKCPECGSKTYGKKNIAKGECKTCNYQFTEEDLENAYLSTTFGVGTIWDLGDTYGEALDLNSELITNTSNYRFNNLRLKCPFLINYTTKILQKGCTDGKTIWISIFSSEAEKISTMVHEMAHVMLGHFEQERDLPLFELEAESVAYLVTSAMGIENHKAAAYIDGWCRDNPADKIKNGEHLLKVAEDILEVLEVDF